MQIIYEATDAMIYYGVENEDTSVLAWTTYFSSGPRPGHGGPVGAYSPPSAWRETGIVGAYAEIEFYGPACVVLGVTSGVTLTALVDDKEASLKLPYNDSAIAIVEGLPVGWHLLSLKMTAVNETLVGSTVVPGPKTPETGDPGAAIPEGITLTAAPGTMALERVVVDTGLPDNITSVTTYLADQNVWNLSGNWTQGTTQSLVAHNQGDSASLREALPSHSVVFLYGNVGKSYGLLEVAWGEVDATALGALPRLVYTGESDSDLSDALLFMGVVPEDGYDNFYFTNTDGRDARKLEFTRLEVYAAGQNGQLTSSTSLGGADPSSSTTMLAPSSSTLPAAVIGASVAGVVMLFGVMAISFLVVRRRRRAGIKQPTSILHPLSPSSPHSSSSNPWPSPGRQPRESATPQKQLLTRYYASKRMFDAATMPLARHNVIGPVEAAASWLQADTSQGERSQSPKGPETAPPAYFETHVDC